MPISSVDFFKDDGSNDDMILHNSDITLKINQSDSGKDIQCF